MSLQPNPRTCGKRFNWIAELCAPATALLLITLCAASAQGQTANSPKPAPAAAAAAGPAAPVSGQENLSTAPTAELLKVYAELRSLSTCSQYAIAENAVWKRDRATFTFNDGKLSFAAPVAGSVVAAAFDGDATFELDPPTAIEQNQIARFTGEPKLVEQFHHAIFYFTDDSWTELEKLVHVRQGAGAEGAGREIEKDEVRFQQKFNDWPDNGAPGYFTMRNLAARMLSDLSDPSSRGIFLADIRDGQYSNLLYEISWNRPSILMPGLPDDEEVTLLHYRSGYYEWWAGYHLSAEYQKTQFPERPLLEAHCSNETLWTTIDDKNRLSAKAELKFNVVMGTPRVVPFNLADVLRIESITGADGKPLEFIQEARNLDSDPWLILPSPAAPGKTYDIKMAYREDSTGDSRVIVKMGTGLYFTQERESWFPSFGPFVDRTEFDLHFISPKKYEFVATGHLVSERKEKDGLASEYTSQIPFSVVGFNYGDFVSKSSSGPGLTVTAYAGRHLTDELGSLQNALDIGQMMTGRDIAAENGILTGGFNTAAGAKYAAAKSFNAFELYQHYFGPLPFHTIRVTEQPVGFFGQSWPTLIFLPYLSLLDTTTLNSLRLENTAGGRQFFDEVAVHEMSHQWWGHMLGWRTYHDQWLSEGFADFSAALYMEAFEPKEFKAFWDHSRELLLSKDKDGHLPVDVAPLWLNYQGNSQEEPGEAQLLMYNKGSYVLEMLRTIMQMPGSPHPDERFISMMHDFVQTYATQDPSTQDFERIVAKHFGKPVDWFFDEWVYGTTTPHYYFSYELTDAAQGKTLLHMSLQQSNVPDSFKMEVPVYIEWEKEPVLAGFLAIQGPETATANVMLPRRPQKVEIDALHTLLAVEKQ